MIGKEPMGDGLHLSDRSDASQPSFSPEMEDSEYEIWREFILQRYGHFFSRNRRRFLRRRLWERMHLLGIKNYRDFYHYVAFNPNGENEWRTLQELLLNHETSFFRHKPSFEALSKHVLPRLRRDKQKHGMNMITMWSAGCSTGQEAYSLAMVFSEACSLSPQPLGEGGWGGVLLTVCGSDIGQRALVKARRGCYKARELRDLSEYSFRNYLKTIKDGAQEVYQVVDEIRALVRYGYLHLNDPQSYWVSGQDIIFCQNVLLYFKPESRLEIITRLCRRLNPGGYLFLDPAEIVEKLPHMQSVRLEDVLIYQRMN